MAPSAPSVTVPYLVASRQGARQFDAGAALTVETASKATLQLHKEVSDDGQEVRLYCCSQQRAQKERDILERCSRRFEQGLTRLSEGLSPRLQSFSFNSLIHYCPVKHSRN